jgi:hypothetical protein
MAMAWPSTSGAVSSMASKDHGQDGGVTKPGVLLGLQHEHAGPLAHDEAVALGVEGAGGALRVVVAPGEGADDGHGGHGERRHRGLAAAGQQYFRLAQSDEVEGVANGVGSRGAGAVDGGVRPANP